MADVKVIDPAEVVAFRAALEYFDTLYAKHGRERLIPLAVELMQHQREGVTFLTEGASGTALRLSRGLGKTLLPSTRSCQLQGSEGDADRLLVICPNSP